MISYHIHIYLVFPHRKHSLCWLGICTILSFKNNPLYEALNFSLFGCIFILRTKGMTCLHNNLVQNFFFISYLYSRFVTISKSLSFFLSLSLFLSTDNTLKTHTTRFKLFFQYLQRYFSKFGQNHLLLDSSIDQYLPLML